MPDLATPSNAPAAAAAAPARWRLAQLNTCTPEDFCEALAEVWEHAPWVAQAVVAQRPFASVDDLHRAMVAHVAGLDEARRVAFFAGHPELAGRAARAGTMTEASIDEQGSLGLGRLDGEDAAAWDALNAAYRERFGFPFILCIRRHTRDSALAAFRARLTRPRADELAAALAEIGVITALRLRARVEDDAPPPASPSPTPECHP
ncbi:2-oxo-4-hydroxy-4-carboxy-5-ureidoimidazoline decarboxylase [Pseudacidovorax sp. RU35E]|uniref:2-oxo-4-hydroxy-4-carboxy-5-ureidoimidazoline decarboxylase n=1 Tax=Pseudacidovorax sp. RU35E TaxID=1907403 RepID=UPI000953DA66|nr:2-oxo-4-hydroxy-4-carboxy-5-ureidoimidazoline decarboxylase [Pseudacidovorax sp. RU35E]SIQ08629.1 2-oxo-4-hydroxy-4-carboxy-5-ureidoimidazoline decarboxylase [Pseudacidovorax sp. RU35E]